MTLRLRVVQFRSWLANVVAGRDLWCEGYEAGLTSGRFMATLGAPVTWSTDELHPHHHRVLCYGSLTDFERDVGREVMARGARRGTDGR